MPDLTEPRTQPPGPTPPAGWYADPERPVQQRYWDGSQWTEQLSGDAPPPTASTGAARRPPRSWYRQWSVWAVIATMTLLVLPFVVGAIRYFDEQSAPAMKASAQATTAAFLSAVRKGDYLTACSLLGRPYVNGSTGPRQDSGWLTACRTRYLPRKAKLLRNAKVGTVVELHRSNAWQDYFPINQLASVAKDQDVDSASVAITGAPGARAPLSPARPPTFALSDYEGVGGGGCGRAWCITQTPLGPIGKP